MSISAFRTATVASSPAGNASMARRPSQQKRVDFQTGCCGLSLPTLFQRIGTMAADGQPLATRVHAARQPRVCAHPGNHFSQREPMSARAGPHLLRRQSDPEVDHWRIG
jgi:hypothetical protein